ncbi:hypothetical protein C8R45DRAFT_961500 [Mycena sanguinolenta]|nr:hypothetical protein C8R45DRAFT_961500 [Mycena sanguinolenta]
MVGLSSLSLQVILCVLVALSAASPAPRATTVPLPTPPNGSQVVYVAATDPGITWSDGWQTGPSSCSSDQMRTVSGNIYNDANSFVASYSFRGSGIYANLQSGDAAFAITVDGVQSSFGYAGLLPVPANCSYDWSATNLGDDSDHSFMLIALGPSLSNDGFWTLSLNSLAIIQPGSSNSSSGSSSNSTSSTTVSNPSFLPSASSAQSSSTGTNSGPSPSSSAAGSGGHGGLSSTDIIAVVTSIIGGVASIVAIITGIYQFKKWREAKRRAAAPSHVFLSGVVHENKPLIHNG